MKKITFLILAVALTVEVYSQSPNWLWANSAIGSGLSDEVANSVATDAFGNIISTGYFSGTSLTFGSVTLTSGGGNDIYIVKQDAAGNVLWANSAGGNFNDYGTDIAVDALGNSIVVGNFNSSTITFGSTTLTNSSVNNADLFIVKYDAAGNVIWAKSAVGNLYDAAGSVSTDASGNIIIGAGFTSGTLTLGSTTLSNSGDYDFLIAKLDSGGNFLWARAASGSNMEYGTVAFDYSGNIVLSGAYLSPTITFGSTILTNAGSSWDIFIAKYDDAGNLLWAKTAGGPSSDAASSITVDASDNIITVGSFSSPSISFGNVTLTNPSRYVIKFDATGNALWGNSGGMINTNSVFADASGNIISAGYFSNPIITIGTDTFTNADTIHFSSDLFLIKFDSSGNILWVKTEGGTGADVINTVTTDASGKIIVAGTFRSSTFNLSPVVLTNIDALGHTNDLFIAKMDTATITGIDVSASLNITAIYPNPFSLFTTIHSTTVFNNATLTVYNLYGQQVKQLKNIAGQSFTLHRDNLPNGLYYIRMTQDNQIISSNKIIITD